MSTPPAFEPYPPTAGPPARRPTSATPADIAWLMGMTTGCARGLRAGRRRALVTVVDARFGPLDARGRQRLARLPPEAIDTRLRDAIRAPDVEAFWALAGAASTVSDGRG